MRKSMLFIALCAGVATIAPAHAGFAPGLPRAAAVGDAIYDVKGQCPNDNPYTGTVMLDKSVPLRNARWTTEGATLTGKVLDQGGTLAIAFREPTGDGGLMTMRRGAGGVYTGSWAYYEGKALCEETWTPKPAKKNGR